MRPRMRLTPTLEAGLLKASATVQDPDVRLSEAEDEMPVLTIEDGGVVIELEFADRDGLHRFQRRVAELALVQALLDAGDNYATRGELLPVLFPDEFTNRGRVLTDPTKLDRRLRQLVSRVNAHVGQHPDGRPLIGNLRARSDVEGGYRIEVDPDRRFILQEDRHVV